MNGIEFYDFLWEIYTQDGQPLYDNYTFYEWFFRPRINTYSFRFNIPNQNPKSIPDDIIIWAWNANRFIDDTWLLRHFNVSFHNDCRLHVLNFLLQEYKNLK
ncbi:MAG: hypothetical protein WCL14_05455 [Bacteroidota bacterium]